MSHLGFRMWGPVPETRDQQHQALIHPVPSSTYISRSHGLQDAHIQGRYGSCAEDCCNCENFGSGLNLLAGTVSGLQDVHIQGRYGSCAEDCCNCENFGSGLNLLAGTCTVLKHAEFASTTT